MEALRQPNGGGGFEAIPGVVEQVQPSVVTVLTDVGIGSGVVWDEDGVIVTNAHVVEGATEVQVAFADGVRADAGVVATDPRTDLAVLQTERIDLPAATFSDELPRVGSLAIAIGSPLGLEETVTAGIISGLHREVPGSATQIERPRRPAPDRRSDLARQLRRRLVAADGRVIGINVAYLPPAGGAVSIGFAIPSPDGHRRRRPAPRHRPRRTRLPRHPARPAHTPDRAAVRV